MDGKVGMGMLKRIVIFCLVVIMGCFGMNAQAADRWKWYYSSDYYGHYYDTQTVKYNGARQYATIWTKTLKQDGSLLEEDHIILDYQYKATGMVEYVTYHNGYPRRHSFSKPVISFVAPDSARETLSRLVAEQLGIRPMYPGGADRWKWVHATDRWSVYVAKDTLIDLGKGNLYSIWAKRVYLNGGESKIQYFCDLTRDIIRTRYSKWRSTVPDSDEEAVLNAVKALNVGA